MKTHHFMAAVAAISIVGVTSFQAFAAGPGSAPTGGNVDPSFTTLTVGSPAALTVSSSGNITNPTAGTGVTVNDTDGLAVGTTALDTVKMLPGGVIRADNANPITIADDQGLQMKYPGSPFTNTLNINVRGDMKNLNTSSPFNVVRVADNDGFVVGDETSPTPVDGLKISGTGVISNPGTNNGGAVLVEDSNGLQFRPSSTAPVNFKVDSTGILNPNGYLTLGNISWNPSDYTGTNYINLTQPVGNYATKTITGTYTATQCQNDAGLSSGGTCWYPLIIRDEEGLAMTVNTGSARQTNLLIGSNGILSNPGPASSPYWGEVNVDDPQGFTINSHSSADALEVYSDSGTAAYIESNTGWYGLIANTYNYANGTGISTYGGKTGIYATANGGSSGVDTAVLADGSEYGTRSYATDSSATTSVGVYGEGRWEVPGSIGVSGKGRYGMYGISNAGTGGGTGVYGESSPYSSNGVGVDGRGGNGTYTGAGVRGTGVGSGSQGAQTRYKSTAAGADTNVVNLSTSTYALDVQGKSQFSASVYNAGGIESDATGMYSKGVVGTATGYASIGVSGTSDSNIGVSGGCSGCTGVSGYGATGVSGTASSYSSGQAGLFMNGLYYAKLSTPTASVEADGPIVAKGYGRIYTVTGTRVDVAANTYAYLGSATCSDPGDRVLSCSISAGSNVLLADTYPYATSCVIYVKNVGATSMGVYPKVTCIDPNGSPW